MSRTRWQIPAVLSGGTLIVGAVGGWLLSRRRPAGKETPPDTAEPVPEWFDEEPRREFTTEMLDQLQVDAEVNDLQQGIERRQRELGHVADSLATAAQTVRRRAATAKVLVVILGAVAATSGTANIVAGADSKIPLVMYALVGLAITTVGGLEVGFKLSERTAELTILAAASRAALREVDSRWQVEVRPAHGSARVAATSAVIRLQDEKLADAQAGAARLGIIIPLEVRELKDIAAWYADGA